MMPASCQRSSGTSDLLVYRPGPAFTIVPVIDYPITHLVLAWPANQAHALRAELIRMAEGLALQGRLAPVVQGADAAGASPRE